MNRRNFLAITAAGAALPLFWGGIPLSASRHAGITSFPSGLSPVSDRVLVLIHLKGGNDGLNTVIPLDRYPELTAARPDILIPYADVLKLTDAIGLHPAMTGMSDLYWRGQLAIVQGVGYPNQNISHLRSTGIWMSALHSDERHAGTWMDRFAGSGRTTACADESLASQLSAVSRMIAGGNASRVYLASLGGFDTHEHQTGRHAMALAELSSAVREFQRELERLGCEDRVIGMTFSEFGRMIRSNRAGGTEHGAAAPLFVFGKHVQGGIIGRNPVLPSIAEPEDAVAMQRDFRSIYASILREWFGLTPDQSSMIIPKTYPLIPLIASHAAVV